jgi:hypothetical protein
VWIVEDHRHAVFTQDDILLKEVGALAVGEGFGRERVLRQIAAGAAMRDDERPWLRRGENREGEEEQGE